MGRFIPNEKTILSVYPAQLQPVVSKHNGLTKYELAPAEPDKIIVCEPKLLNPPKGYEYTPPVVKPCDRGNGYTLLRVQDTFQFVRDLTSDNQDAVIQMPVPAEAVIQNLTNVWTSVAGNESDGTNGVVAIEGETPTEEELKRARAQQNSLFRFLIQQANDFWRQGRSREIQDKHRIAARGLGDTTFPWYQKIEQASLKKCPACAKDILTPALVCEHCQTNLVKFYEEMGLEPDEKADPVVFGMLKARAARKPASMPPPLTPNAPKVAARQ